MSRIKPDKPPVISDLKGAEAALERMAANKRSLDAIAAEMNEGIDKLKAQAGAKAEPIKARQKDLAKALASFGELNKAELFKHPKSRELAFGVIGFRKNTKLATRTKFTLAKVLEKLKAYSFTEAIRSKETVDKEAMRDWPDERLELVGMQRVTADEFFIELKEEPLKE